MALFDIFKKSTQPYSDSAANLVYELLFCDNLDLYKKHNQQPGLYPWNILFARQSSIADLQKITEDQNAESRVKILAYNKMLAAGQKPHKQELLAVIVEIGLDDGLVVLASFRDGTARYINATGRILIWETRDQQSDALTQQLFREAAQVVQQIGPWHEARRPHPIKDHVRLSFLVSDGLYFGEGPCNVLFQDALAAPSLTTAGQLMQYLTEKVINPDKALTGEQ